MLITAKNDPGNDLMPGMQEERMDPPPDFGYDSYKGSGKLKNKVCSLFLAYAISFAADPH